MARRASLFPLSFSLSLFLSLSLFFLFLDGLEGKPDLEPQGMALREISTGMNVEGGCERELKAGKGGLKIFIHCDEEGFATEVVSVFVWKYGSWERKKIRQFTHLMGLFNTNERITLDIGAHIGQFSLHLASLGHEVVAFEPFDSNYELFRKSISKNRLGDQITLYEHGLSDSYSEKPAVFCPLNRGVVRIFEEEELLDRSKWPSCCEFPGDPCEITELRLEPLDEVLEKYMSRKKALERGDSSSSCHTWLFRPPVSLMKIDVEGHELEVLKGASGLLGDFYARPRVISMEFLITPQTIDRCEEMVGVLMGYGYNIFLNDNFMEEVPLLFIEAHEVREKLEYVMGLREVLGLDLVAVVTEVTRTQEFYEVARAEI